MIVSVRIARFFFFCLFSLAVFSQERPNILFLLSDDQAWNGLSVQMHPEKVDSKHPYIQTPSLEKLASQGMRFSSAYSPAPVCSPTRISLQTGKSPAKLHWTKAGPSVKARHNRPLIGPVNIRSIADGEITIAEKLKEAGYRTAHFGKWHIDGGGPGDHGYDGHDGNLGNEHAYKFTDPNPVDIFGMVERSKAFMRDSLKRGKPFFVQMSFHALHAPQNAMKTTKEKYRKRMPNANAREIGKAAIAEDLDTGVGELMDFMDENGLREKTYIIYMGDNGGMEKTSILRGGKGDLWEAGVRVPFILTGPNVFEKWCHERIVGFDLYPTFCEWAGISPPNGVDGGSIAKMILDPKGTKVVRPSEAMVFHFPHYQGDTPHSSIYLDQWKLIKFYENGESFLYDLNEDMGERNDLSKQNKAMSAFLEKKLEMHLAKVNAQMPTVNSSFDPSVPSLSTDKKGKKKKRSKNK